MKNEYLKIGNTTYHVPTYGQMSYKKFVKEFPDHRGAKEIYDLIYIEYHGKPNDNKIKGVEEKAIENAEQPSTANGDSELVVSE